jgi:prolyl-tRNA synthetase
MSISHGIEVGQVFKLGTKYSEKMGALFQDEQGRTRPAQMGCYGIGVNRIVASAIEVSHDQRGIIWPKQIAPYQIIITSINPKDPKVWEASERIYNSLLSTGMEVLWDDRDLTAGVKFMDADLIGIPVRVTVGTKTVESGSIDIKPRNKSEMVTVPLERALGQIKDVWDAYEI